MLLEVSENNAIFQSLISAASVLLGVIVGGCITEYHHRIERKNNYITDQLRNFYGPLMGMCAQTIARANALSKSTKTRIEVRTKQLKETSNPDTINRISEGFGQYDKKLGEYNKKQFENETFPVYQNMLDHFERNMWLAEPSTLTFHDRLVEQVDILKRYKEDVIEPGVFYESFKRLDELSEDLRSFNKDLLVHYEKLKKKLRVKP